MHTEFDAVEHVSDDVQPVTGVHAGQLSTIPFWRKKPGSQFVHCEVVAETQVSALLQWVMSAHDGQASAWLVSSR